MQIQVNTDKKLGSHHGIASRVERTITSTLSHLSARITRVNVHIHDENVDPSGQDHMQCVIEARVAGQRPTAVSCEAPSLPQAITGATDKLKSSLESTLGKRNEHR